MKSNNKDGFTIIEVVLVLAVAGLIFLAVFIAVPSLRRNQRDTARKQDVSNVASGITTFMSNNKGAFPNGTQLRTVASDVSENTDVTKITIANSNSTKLSPADSAIIVMQGKKCGTNDGTGVAPVTGTKRQFILVTKLESANGSYFCQDS